jgi:outer membrane protein
LLLAAAAAPLLALANVDPLIDTLAEPGSAGLGLLIRAQPSPYRGAGDRFDFVPLYLYEGERLFLHATRAGIKLINDSDNRLDLILNYRFEGYPVPDVPPELAGMKTREPSADLGFAYRWFTDWGTLHGELLYDAFHVHGGIEARLGYSYDWTRARWTLRPSAFLAFRSAKLNDYYYGVQPEEALPTRPAYAPGSGLNAWLGLYASYQLSEGWHLIGGAGVQLMDRDIADSPIVKTGVLPTAFLGAAYDFGSYKKPERDGSPLYIKALYGQATACKLFDIVTFRCFDTDTPDGTSIAAIELGKPLAERVNGWPMDFVGYLGLLRHFENGKQSDSWQVNGYVKLFYYGFPWSEHVRTRVGLGVGFSYAERVPWEEVRDAAEQSGTTSRLLNYVDPTVDINLGDVVRSKRLKDTWLGIGVSHRSGVFGTSQLLNNVDGGSNYIYTYVETKI